MSKIVPEDKPVFTPDGIVEATRAGDIIETTGLRKDGTKIPVKLGERL